ncbi:MAG: hypothetical protein ACP5N9_00425 [Candidatus Bilamarchaeum sp.]|jgi:hypothetical protein
MFSFNATSSAKGANGIRCPVIIVGDDNRRLSNIVSAYKFDDAHLGSFASSDLATTLRRTTPCAAPFDSVLAAFGPLLAQNAGQKVYSRAAANLVEVAGLQVDFSVSDGGFLGSLFGPRDPVPARRSLRATIELGALQVALVHGILSESDTLLPPVAQTNLLTVLSMADQLRVDRVSLNF